MNYTKGPWVYLHTDETIIGGQDRNGRIIARMGDLPKHDDYIMAERENALRQYEADANLIAAAPEMHDLLRRLYTAISVDKVTDELHMEINTVLNKAEGK